MKIESLLGIALELSEIVALPRAYPSDARVGRFFRERRYLGSRDRRLVGDLVFEWLRRSLRARALWRRWLALEGIALPVPDDDAIRAAEAAQVAAEAGEAPELAARRSDELRRVYLLDVLALAREGRLAWSFEETALAASAVPPPAGADADAWSSIAQVVATRADFLDSALAEPTPAGPAGLALEASLPEWIAADLIERLGEEGARALALSLLEPAPLDLRVKLQAKSRDAVRAHLERDTGADVETTPHSHLGLRLRGRVNLTSTLASRNSWIEVQDEGSQIAVLATDPRLGKIVIDACAGSGGKTLAFIDILFRTAGKVPRSKEEGHVIACDVQKPKLLEFRRRATEGGSSSRVEIVHVYPAGPLPESLPSADIVFVDAPCSGLGTLRRNPDLKRRHDVGDIARLGAEQLAILERFAPLVRQGGVLALATCSILLDEGERVAQAFGAQHPEFKPYPSLWARKNLPPAAIDGHLLRLDPVVTGTDGFFIATWERDG